MIGTHAALRCIFSAAVPACLVSITLAVPINDRASPVAVTTDEVVLADGFRIDLMYAVPPDEQGSWVALATDNVGRLIASDQEGHLYRIQPGEQAADTNVERLQVEVGCAQGLLYAYNSLYVTANLSQQAADNTGYRAGLYRLIDRDGDDQFDEIVLLRKLTGMSEHGPHGLQLGPDGLIYLISGNREKTGDGIAEHSPFRNWADDLLVPSKENGLLPAGWVMRTDKEGKAWELICGGLRNPYDIAFDANNELFTCDADSESDIGTGWYRPTRINHIVSAGEYGWRYDGGPWLPYGKWPDFYPDSVGSVVDIGVGSPAGMVMGTGTRFPAKYQRALFSSDWAWGKIYAIHLQPQGSTYSATFETFLEGTSLPIADIVVHPNGDMYFICGGRKAASGLFRIRYVGDEPVDPVGPLVDHAATEARQIRRRLEQFHGRQDSRALDESWRYLEHPDRAIRYAARIAVEHQPLELWRERALQENRSWAVIQVAIALARKGVPADQTDAIQLLNQLPLEQLSEAQMLSALRAYGLVMVRLGGQIPVNMAAARSRLKPLFPSESDQVNRELCRLLVYLEASDIVQQSLSLLHNAQTQADQTFYLSTLVQCRAGWTLDQRREFFRWLNLAQATHLSGSDALGRAELDDRRVRLWQSFRDDMVQQLSDDERNALKSVIEEQQLEGLQALESTRRILHNWQMSDLVPLLKDVNQGRSFKNGRSAYRAAQCAKCHRFGDQGGTTGPDVTAVGKRFQPTYILEALLVPSKVVPDQYRTEIIETVNGKIHTGRVVHESNKQLQLRTDPFARRLINIPLAEIESRSTSNTSEMPAGLLNILTKTEILDLIAYLRSGGDPNDLAFR